MEWTLWWAIGYAVISFLVHAVGRSRAKRCVGVELCAAKGPMAWSLLYMLLGSAALIWVLTLGALPALQVALLLVLSSGAIALSFSSADQVCGLDGVRSGAWAFRYSDLEEWRLTGEHLRFRSGGVWRAVMVPVALQGQLRTRLEEVSRDTESRFKS